MDKIYVNGMVFYGYHGVYPEEQKLGQRFYADVVLHASLQAAGRTDDLKLTTNYGTVYQEIAKIMTGEPVKLIETLAERIAMKIFADFPLVEAVQVRITKPSAPIPGELQSAAVEIFRERDGK
ncbi:dihydroneopterin aldolase [Tumebacillus permanentifrigoris]|uniref:7,8-dihydroneopterin aldolase n=1 Tax=Tumebacillus permanentifrigoris TaxID=378543 RepID=A0A316D5K4_9BACL|nr:dihydroneopterin aldolase [Tumebacillus permanentifrigoris]PWK06992.1 dihydroneopterin aldolase [Tumebacillus permanentifrigoris]